MLKKQIDNIVETAKKLNFTMSCDTETGQLLRTLAGAKPKGAFLELGTGAGVSTSWILAGMDEFSTLVSVEMDESVQNIARTHIHDERVQFVTMDGGRYIEENQAKTFDFIFADTWPGKYYLLQETLGLVERGGFYIIDDLTPIDAWSDEHKEKARNLVMTLKELDDFHVVEMKWSTGLIIATRK